MTKTLGLAALVLVLVSPVAFAQSLVFESIDECYRLYGDSRAAGFCADQELAREIEILNRRLDRQQPPPPDRPGERTSTIYRCSNDPDPQLQKLIVSKNGQVLRTDSIQTFTEGDDDQEREACRVELERSPASISQVNKSQCTCSADSDPKARLELIHPENFQTILTVDLITFTKGDDHQERRDCRTFIRNLPICNLP